MTSAHATSGTQRRPAHPLSGDGLVFDIEDELDALRADLSRSSGRRSAKTLAKAGGLRLTLVVLDAGARLEPEARAGGASLHVLEGRLRVQTDGEVHELGPGRVIALTQNLREPIEAVDAAAFLITVAWPEGAGAWPEEAAAGRL